MMAAGTRLLLLLLSVLPPLPLQTNADVLFVATNRRTKRDALATMTRAEMLFIGLDFQMILSTVLG
jgi:hypothetical protein